ncbi:hypothetical protein [Clostridium sporogenes]|uniref:hypothetical protein n=1 Tax=Clostridium sporogenes TaxID=1509 RepID=UPI0013D31A63|nr:hypothetical protein [Clostridium sporogenes]MCW6124223.1 hypothetical protein [Clostridium sporogenes]NFH40114.1 hypothetical protein [Clostridium sporogenes]
MNDKFYSSVVADLDTAALRITEDSKKMNGELCRKIEEAQKEIEESNRQEYERKVQNNENLKKLVDYNSEITEYNRQLVTLNESILRKINFVNTSLDFVIEAIVENTEITKKDGIEHNALLLELITIMESKDKGKIKEFLGGLTGNVAAGVMVEYLKFKLGIS